MFNRDILQIPIHSVNVLFLLEVFSSAFASAICCLFSSSSAAILSAGFCFRNDSLTSNAAALAFPSTNLNLEDVTEERECLERRDDLHFTECVSRKSPRSLSASFKKPTILYFSWSTSFSRVPNHSRANLISSSSSEALRYASCASGTLTNS